ncbi:hypothetical protein [Levilactobacillus cerevisiae]|nr:hypothetical protein [Levilactobacillus cerevisiae]
MNLNWTKKTATILLSSTLLGGVLLPAIPTFTTQVQADSLDEAPVSYQTFKNDEGVVKAAVKKANPAVQRQINAAFFKRMEADPVNAYGRAVTPYFSQVMQALESDAVSNIGSHGQVTSAFKQDYTAMIAVYNQFKSRLEPMYQDSLSDEVEEANQAVNANKVDSGTIEDVADYFIEYFQMDLRPDTVTGMPAVKSRLTKLTAKKTSSKKNVKVTGTAKLGKKANYAQIKTSKGTSYAKLSRTHHFSKKIYAPKVKKVTVAVGYYAHGQFSRVTNTKTVSVK